MTQPAEWLILLQVQKRVENFSAGIRTLSGDKGFAEKLDVKEFSENFRSLLVSVNLSFGFW
jgi:hypothetical protein